MTKIKMQNPIRKSTTTTTTTTTTTNLPHWKCQNLRLILTKMEIAGQVLVTNILFVVCDVDCFKFIPILGNSVTQMLLPNEKASTATTATTTTTITSKQQSKSDIQLPFEFENEVQQSFAIKANIKQSENNAINKTIGFCRCCKNTD
jgi:hypothetical protein